MLLAEVGGRLLDGGVEEDTQVGGQDVHKAEPDQRLLLVHHQLDNTGVPTITVSILNVMRRSMERSSSKSSKNTIIVSHVLYTWRREIKRSVTVTDY